MECMGIGMRVKGRQPRGHATLFLLCMQTHGEVNWKAAITCHNKPPRWETTEGPDSVFGLCDINLLFLPLLMCNVVIAAHPMRLLLLKPLQSLVVAASRDCSQSPGVCASFVLSLEDVWTDTEIESLQVWLAPTQVASDVLRPVSGRLLYCGSNFSFDSTLFTCQLLVVKVQLCDASVCFTLSCSTFVWVCAAVGVCWLMSKGIKCLSPCKRSDHVFGAQIFKSKVQCWDFKRKMKVTWERG